HLLTASYLDESIRALESEINRKGLLFLCEMGLDPGIDHMSAMQLVHGIKNQGGIIRSFMSHCGGLIAPESDDNPWHYKITWNPANVVNAGKTGAVYKQEGKTVERNYKEIFKDNPTVDISGLGSYACYPNRDSLSYAKRYGLETAHTFIRTTLRHPDFCKGWQYIIEAGLTDASEFREIDACKSIADWFNHSARSHSPLASFNDYINAVVTESDRDLVQRQMEYLGLNSSVPLPSGLQSSADVMRHLLETRLKMQATDRDMIIMLHEIDYEKNNQLYSAKSCMIVKGDDALNTAMAKTVGLPLGIAAELILEKKINISGLKIPVTREIYEPVLIKLKEKEIKFEDL
ncbi:MAG TPA: saccharopine dehydrogenase C-terminal domain-containing protein, partial [Niabella sp.]|nr:saccharopine dehydrogenase C-terminal domain-containing protein [Niabella sp.]